MVEKIASGGRERPVSTAEELAAATKDFAGQPVTITVNRSGQTVVVQTKLLDEATVAASRDSDEPKGYLGVSPNELVVQRSTWSAPIVAVGFTKQLIELTVQGLGKAVAGLGSTVAGGLTGNDQARQSGQSRATEQVGGPVAIVAILWGGGTLGINFILFIIAIISLTLALMNILPIPALDGGRLFIIYLSRLLKGRPFSALVEERIHGTGMAILLTLFLLITVVDVKRFF
jgi:regulator of sigma E protease